jgi:hypothetical protein
MYTDPGSGLLVLQLLSSSVIGAVYFFRVQIKRFFSRTK